MASIPSADSRPLDPQDGIKTTRPQAAALATTAAVLGLFSISSTVLALWGLWTNDALKSIGMVIPFVSLFLVLRAWRKLDWEMAGTWWGLVVLVATIAAVHLREHSLLVLVLSPSWNISMPPTSLIAFAYGAGMVLLFGGTRLFRAALFPIVLLWFVNPIPHIFNVFVDLPLQRASAHIARGFAMMLGQKLSPDQLRLMFTPDFGMFIAPGCNGIRGAITMGFIALVAGYVYRFKLRTHVLVVVGAVLLGYVFNFVRLCVLVLYYLIALHYPSLQDKAENADYVIGACLFMVAAGLLFFVIRKLGRTSSKPEPAAVAAQPLGEARGFWARLVVVLVVFALGTVSFVRGVIAERRVAAIGVENNLIGQFPQQLGQYHQVRSWKEALVTGTVLYHWAEYAPADNGPHISVGISPVLGAHDTLVCHSARGEDPLWRGESRFLTADGNNTSFSTSFFNDNVTQYIEATTLCSGVSCGESTVGGKRFGFVYTTPDAQNFLTQDPERPLPVLLKIETIDTTLLPDVARAQLTGELQSFLKEINLPVLTQQYRKH